MRLVGPIGARERLSWQEVMDALGLPLSTVQKLAYSGRLRKRFKGSYPFFFEDVNRFIVDFNNGKVHIGRTSVPKGKSA